VVEKLKPDPPHLQALAALRADLPIEGSAAEWLDKHREQVVAVVEGLTNWGELAKLLGIRNSTLVDWGVRRGLRTRKHREKKPKERKTKEKKPRQKKDPQVLQVDRRFKGIQLTLTLEFLEEGLDSQRSSQRGE